MHLQQHRPLKRRGVRRVLLVLLALLVLETCWRTPMAALATHGTESKVPVMGIATLAVVMTVTWRVTWQVLQILERTVLRGPDTQPDFHEARPDIASPDIHPARLFNILFLIVAMMCVIIKVSSLNLSRSHATGEVEGKDKASSSRAMRSLRWRFLAVFWLFKMADWLKGPYFYEVYANKFPDDDDDLWVSRLFLTGFLAAAVLSPVAGSIVDTCGRKFGSLVFAVVYAMAALSTHATSTAALFTGRVFSGLGTALLFCAPEAWLVGEHERGGFSSSDLSGTFSLAYLGDAIVAILAGLLADYAAQAHGATAPFDCSVICLVIGGCVAVFAWGESLARHTEGASGGSQPVHDALQAMLGDPRILTVGAVQALFEGSMYIFVLQWPMVIHDVLPGLQVPYGKVFSCFMACCMVGSSLLNHLLKLGPPEKVMACMLLIGALTFGAAALRKDSLTVVLTAFFTFEGCVGVYFPLIGVLRGKYIPDKQRGMMMSLFRLPLNLIVSMVIVVVQPRLGPKGAMWCSCFACSMAFGAQVVQTSLKPRSRV